MATTNHAILFKDAIINFVKRNENYNDCSAGPTNREIIKFLNKNKDEMICRNGAVWVNYLHYALMVRHHNIIFDQLFYGILYDEDEPSKDFVKLDYNVVSYFKNEESQEIEPMTLVDYINKVVKYSGWAVTTKKDIEETRDVIIMAYDEDENGVIDAYEKHPGDGLPFEKLDYDRRKHFCKMTPDAKICEEFKQ